MTALSQLKITMHVLTLCFWLFTT